MRTGPLNNIYPQYKRLAALLGDLVFTITRRVFLQWVNEGRPEVNSWSYLSSYDYGTPVLGTFHASDIPVVYGQKPGFETSSIPSYYLSFVTNLDPNVGRLATLPEWPKWGSSASRFIMNFNAGFNQLITDDFRSAVASYIAGSRGPEVYV